MIVLVSMPFAAVQRPSIALGTLQALLLREGIACRTHYANLTFAAEVGTRAYAAWEEAVGDALFSHLLFPGYAPAGFDAWVGRRLVPGEFQSAREQAARLVDETAAKILAMGARVVGCTSMYWQHTASLALLQRIRQLDPSVVTMLGGANCESVMGRATHQAFPYVDFVVSGEADDFFAAFCGRLLTQGAAAETPFGVFGPVHRLTGYPSVDGGDGAPRAACRDLRKVPTPAYDDYFHALSASPLADDVRPGLLVEAARGCWWGAVHQCRFCGISEIGMQYHAKPAAQILGEMQTLEARHGIKDFEVTDNILDLSYFKTVLPALVGSGRRFFWETKANLKREQVALLAEAGVRWVQPGIESLDSRVLTLMDKGVTAIQNLRLLRWCRELGIRVMWNVLWGFPGEDDDWYAETAKLIPALHHLMPPRLVTRLRYDRYSVYQARAGEYGLTLEPAEAMRMTYDLEPPLLDDLTYYFDAVPPPPPAGSGVRAMQRAVMSWSEAFWGGPLQPLLCVRDDGEALHFLDTRAAAARFRVDGATRSVYLACEDGCRVEVLAARTARSDAEVAAALEELRARAVVVDVDGRVLSLGLRGEVPSMPGGRSFPGGYVRRREARKGAAV